MKVASVSTIAKTLVTIFLSIGCSLLLSGCYNDGAPSETPVYSSASEVRDGNITFGLPSVKGILGFGSNHFGHGKKALFQMPGCQAFIFGTRNDNEGALSIVRDWTIVHNTFDGTYQLRNGQSVIGFLPPLDKTKPTVAELREVFGRWIIFPGDDMGRVRKVHGDFYPEELIFNDGRLPADTYEPDIKKDPLSLPPNA